MIIALSPSKFLYSGSGRKAHDTPPSFWLTLSMIFAMKPMSVFARFVFSSRNHADGMDTSQKTAGFLDGIVCLHVFVGQDDHE